MSSSKQSKQSQSPTSPPLTPHGSKLPKFLQKQNRDRSKSLVDTNTTPSAASSSSSISDSLKIGSPLKTSIIRRSSKKHQQSSSHDREERRPSRQSQDTPDTSLDLEELEEEQPSRQDGADETPVIVEPPAIPRSRARPDRPLSDNYSAVAYHPSSSASSSRLSEIPSRLSGWFSHAFSTSSTDLSLPSLLSQQHLAAVAAGSPKKTSALLTVAKHGKGHLDKAMRYLLDSDATPDKCTDPIWLLGVEHPGYEPDAVSTSSNASLGRRSSVESSHRSPSSFRSSTSTSPVAIPGADLSLSQSQPASSSSTKDKDPSRNWPPVFYADYTSRIWLTYRSQFIPIRDITLEELDAAPPDSAILSGSPQPKKWNWPLGGEKCWTSDAGWGCMLRTGQSLLANALLHVHLGRDWRKPPYPLYTSDYATYVQIITWFLDEPTCPFSVHRMALVGKQLGTKVGQWFGPSVAAGAIKKLVHAFPEAGLGIYIASDGGMIYESEVIASSHAGIGSPRGHVRKVWGERPVLILIGHRLGIDGVNPLYYNFIKTLYTWPQSVGIAGGRPSSSYYFVGSQADNLFYLDPHHARPAIPLRPPPSDISYNTPATPPSVSRQTSPEPTSDREREKSPRTPVRHARSPTSPISIRSSSSFSQRNIVPPSPLQQQISTSSTTTAASYVTTATSQSSNSNSNSHARWHSSSALPDDSEMDSRELSINGEDLDPIQRHYATAYSAAELRTFHCDRVRKMPLSGLDPSMLIGFLCKDESDWRDLKSRIAELNRQAPKGTVLHIQDEPPNWNSDLEAGMESISEPDIDLPEEDDEFSDAQEELRSASASPDTSLPSTNSKMEEDDTEGDCMDPITPGIAKISFKNIRAPGHMQKAPSTSTTGSSAPDSLDFEDEEDEEWLAPEVFTPQPEYGMSTPVIEPPTLDESQLTVTREASDNSHGEGDLEKRKRKSKKKGKDIAPVQFPFPATAGEEEEPKNAGKRVPQMRTQKARDGGRTQSGGVRGIPTDDFDDF
ncbi:peptidase family C54-domain-containing protein [Irpex rosettiformis]|uniref:Peptidase family C54-domain-containing protein n=1 Tax=Irpex rosettiformis TaxID=378272 RepID=A0ACB8U6J0_9APHY|nr:peptidase family C54-domain-containing protein [Irpex rosettiformis]